MYSTNRSGFFLNFLAGTVLGGIMGFLFAPKPGSRLRKDLKEDLDLYLKKVKDAGNKIVDDARKTANDMVAKANQLIALTDKYIGEDLKDSLEKIEKEINSVKSAIHTAVDTYKSNSKKSQNSSGAIADDLFIDFVNENSVDYEDDDLLPLHEGMRRRHDRKYY